MKKILITLFGLAAFLNSTSAAVTRNPVADSYVYEGSTNTNYGTETLIKLKTSSGNNRDGYLKFSMSGEGRITKATLRLNAKMAETPVSDLTVYQVADTNWGETTIKWPNRPSLGPRIDGSNVTTSYAWYNFDVTSYLRSQQASGKEIVSLACTPPTV